MRVCCNGLYNIQKFCDSTQKITEPIIEPLSKKQILAKRDHFFIVIAMIAAFAGLLFGYDTGVISGAILFIKKEFNLSPQMNGLVVSAALIGAFFGAIFSGRLADSIGRKRLLIIDAVIFGVGSIVCALAPDVWTLIAARVGVGVAIGISSYIAPLYISEISPTKYRGALVSLNQLAIGVGVFLSYVVDYFFAFYEEWRGMLEVGVVSALLLFFGMLVLPYSPRWMASKGENKKARAILQKIQGKDAKIDLELSQIEKSLEEQKGTWKMLFAQPIRTALVIGMGLAIIQQVTGINTILYYAPTIFEMSGYESAGAAILATMGVGAVFVLFTIVALPLIDLWGRRPLLLLGVCGMCLGLLGLSFAFYGTRKIDNLQWVALASMLLYVACFAFSLGPIMWLLISEIYPLRIRGLGSSVATCTNWAANWFVSITFLTLVEVLGPSMTFFIYFLVGVLSYGFIYFVVPETKGVLLEKIEHNLMSGKSARHLGR